jgi:hypothetical protein
MRSALARRFRFGAQTLVLLGALLLVCVLAAVLGSRFSARIDLTATREHTLAPRTIRLVEQIDEPHLIVVSADLSRVDAAGRQRLSDVLQNFASIGDDLTVSLIDTGAPGAIEAIQSVVATAASWHQDDIKSHTDAITQTLEEAAALPPRIEGVADALAGLAATLATPEERSRWEDAAAAVRILADDVRTATDAAAATAATRIGAVELPDAENTLGTLAPPMRQVARATSTILEQLPSGADADALAQQSCRRGVPPRRHPRRHGSTAPPRSARATRRGPNPRRTGKRPRHRTARRVGHRVQRHVPRRDLRPLHRERRLHR